MYLQEGSNPITHYFVQLSEVVVQEAVDSHAAPLGVTVSKKVSLSSLKLQRRNGERAANELQSTHGLIVTHSSI